MSNVISSHLAQLSSGLGLIVRFNSKRNFKNSYVSGQIESIIDVVVGDLDGGLSNTLRSLYSCFSWRTLT